MFKTAPSAGSLASRVAEGRVIAAVPTPGQARDGLSQGSTACAIERKEPRAKR